MLFGAGGGFSTNFSYPSHNITHSPHIPSLSFQFLVSVQTIQNSQVVLMTVQSEYGISWMHLKNGP